jgi:hypothetical protein
MAKAVDAVDLLERTIKKEHEQFKGVQPRLSFIENTDEPSVEALLEKFESEEEDEKWDKMYHDPDQDNYILGEKAAAVSFMEQHHRELNRHYVGENEVSIYKHEQVGSANFLTVKPLIRNNLEEKQQ